MIHPNDRRNVLEEAIIRAVDKGWRPYPLDHYKKPYSLNNILGWYKYKNAWAYTDDKSVDYPWQVLMYDKRFLQAYFGDEWIDELMWMIERDDMLESFL